MPDFPSLSSQQLTKLIKKGGGVFVRQDTTDHAIYSRTLKGKRYSTPVQMGKKSLDPVYCKRVMKQLKFTDAEIEILLNK